MHLYTADPNDGRSILEQKRVDTGETRVTNLFTEIILSCSFGQNLP